MSDLMLQKSVQTKLVLVAVSAALTGYVRSLAARVGPDESGQDLVEYAGIIILVAIIIGAIGISPLGSLIGNTISSKITSIVNNK